MFFWILLSHAINSQMIQNSDWTPLELYEYSYKQNEDKTFFDPNFISKQKTQKNIEKLSSYFPKIQFKIFLVNSINAIEFWDENSNSPDIEQFHQHFVKIIKTKNTQNFLICIFSLDDKIKLCTKPLDFPKKEFSNIKKRLNYIIGTPFISYEYFERNQFFDHSSIVLFFFIFLTFIVITILSCCIFCRIGKEEPTIESFSNLSTSSDKIGVELSEIYYNKKQDEILQNSFNLFSQRVN